MATDKGDVGPYLNNGLPFTPMFKAAEVRHTFATDMSLV